MIEVGTTIRVRGNPGRRNARAALGLEHPAAERHRAARGAGRASRTSGSKTRRRRDRASSSRATSSCRTAARARSSAIWSPLISAFPRPRGTPVLTDEGRRAQARYEGGEQAVGDCEVPGMPYAMMSPYPIEIVDQGERLLIRGEAYDLTRVVSARSRPRARAAPSPLGSSVGRFSGDELVIETSGIDYHSYGDLGPAQSNQSRVVERFKLSADGLKLDYEITVTDPVMLAEPWLWGGSFIYREGAEIKPWSCGADRG